MVVDDRGTSKLAAMHAHPSFKYPQIFQLQGTRGRAIPQYPISTTRSFHYMLINFAMFRIVPIESSCV